MVGNVIIVLFALMLFKYLLDNKIVFHRQTIMWLNACILLYFTIQLFSWGVYSYLIRKNLNSKIISDVGYFANVLFYSSLIFLLVRNLRTKERNDII